MAEEEERFEVRAINDLYSKMQDSAMFKYESTIQDLTGAHRNIDFTNPENNAAEVLGQQAEAMTAADDVLGGMTRSNKYTSAGEQAAAVESGIQDKMRAISLLDQTAAAAENSASPAFAEYVDPITGERVSNQTIDVNSAGALRRAQQATIKKHEVDGPDYLNASEGIGSAKDGPLEWQAYWNANKQKMDHKRVASEQYHVKEDSWWDKTFGESVGSDMKGSYEKGDLNLGSLKLNLQAQERKLRSIGEKSVNDAINNERQLRIDNAQANRDTFNAGEVGAREETRKFSAQAQASKLDLQDSIKKDKQTLARQNAGMVKGKKKTRIDYTGGSGTRPA